MNIFVLKVDSFIKIVMLGFGTHVLYYILNSLLYTIACYPKQQIKSWLSTYGIATVLFPNNQVLVYLQ